VRRVVLVVAMIGAAVVASALLIPPRTYLPSGNQNLIFAFVLTPPGYAVEEYRQMAYHVERALRPWWEAKPGSDQLKQLQDAWKQARDQVMVPMMQQQLAGMEQMLATQNKPPQEIAAATAQTRKELERLRNSPPPAGIDNFFFVVFQGMVFMGATSNDPENVGSLAYLFQQATQGIPGTFGVAQQATIFDLGDSFGTTVDVNLSGEQIETVRSAAAIVQGMIMGNLGTFPVPNPQNFALGRQETRVLPDRIRAASAGITTSTIRRATQIAVDGEVIGDYREGAKSIDLTIMAQRPADRGVEALRDLPLAGRSGWVMPLSQVADFVQTDAPQRIRRIEELPAVTLSVPVQQNQTVQQVEDSIWQGVIEPARQQGLIPPEINIRTSGSAAKLSQFMRAFIPGFVLAAVITYLLLAALFESWLHPLVIIMSVPFALVGGFLGLRLMHEYQPDIQLDVLTMLGFVILIGTIVNNPILIVHQALNYLREGMDRQHAIALSTQTRVRPIFMSVITSVAGMAPLVLLGGAGSELYRGLGAVVIGGLLLSTVFTLFLTPTLMSLALDAQAGLGRLLRRERRPRSPHGGPRVEDLRQVPASAHNAGELALSRSPSPQQP
jgi:HAE1 family hydrophobic/amphiphilic exporter-1